MTDEELKAIEKRAEDATPGPWLPAAGWVAYGEASDSVCTCEAVYGEQRENDAFFIAHARQDVPKLIAEVRRLHAQEETMKVIALEPCVFKGPNDYDQYDQCSDFTTDGDDYWAGNPCIPCRARRTLDDLHKLKVK